MIEDFVSNEYIIKDMYPLRPLMNFLWNDSLIASLDQFGFGESKALTETNFRLLNYGERLIYIKDKDGFYAANRNYSSLPFSRFETHVGLNYQRIISSYKGLDVEYTIFVPSKGYVEISNIKIRNATKEKKVFDLYFYCRPFINLTWHTAYSRAYYCPKCKGMVFSHFGYDIEEKNQVIVIKSNMPISFYETSDIYFKGIYNELSSPIGLSKDSLSNTDMSFDGSTCNALQFKIELEPSEEKEINVVSSLGKSIAEASSLANRYLSSKSIEKELSLNKKKQDELNSKLVISTSDSYLDVLVNIWLKRQINLGKSWGRVYGKGFRDVMQDISAFLSLDPKKAREKILSTLAYQFESGNTIRQFEPIFDYPYQDGATWIAPTLLSYLKETNDFSILDEEVNYYKSSIKEDVYSHMQRGLDYLYNDLGKHGLVRWRGGDWNDSLNAAGLNGIGESVWLSIATVKSSSDFIEISSKLGKDTSILESKKKTLEENILKYGFEGDRFIYGYNDLEEKVGSSSSKEGKLYLNPQTWAVLANIGTKLVQKKVMDKVEKELACEYGYAQLKPCYTKGDENIGRATYFSPGCYENGSVYNHGVAFKMAANLELRQPELAYKTLKKLYPLNNKPSGMEEYAIGNMYFGKDAISRAGFAPMPWISGTPGWIYKNVSELMCGIKPDYDGLIIDPCLPRQLKTIHVERLYQGVRYFIDIRHTGKKKILVNGKSTSNNKIKRNNKKMMKVIYEY